MESLIVQWRSDLARALRAKTLTAEQATILMALLDAAEEAVDEHQLEMARAA
jgi:hypothetical protein